MLASVFWAERNPMTGSGSVIVTPNDSADLVNPATNQTEIGLSIWAESAVTVTVICADGNTDVIPLPAMVPWPTPIKRLMATGTGTGVNIHVVF